MIRNYPGVPQTSGEHFAQVLRQQIDIEGISITEKTVTGVFDMGSHFTLLCNKERFEAKTIILATGVETVSPVPGELEFIGRGVSYCATCDGNLYNGKTIAVLCTSKELEHEITYLADVAKHVYLFPLYRQMEVSAPNITVLHQRLLAVQGTQKVQQLRLTDGTLAVDGVFMLKCAVAPSVLVPGLQAEGGHVVVAPDMSTNIKGCFAAGDCTGRPYQYAKAVGEGNIAAHSVMHYLTT